MLLLVLGLLASPVGRAEEAGPRAVLAQVTRALEKDSAAAYQRHQERPAAGGSPSAMFALGTVARLTYRYEDAERWYRRLVVADGEPRTVWELYALLGLGLGAAARSRQAEAVPLLERVARERAGIEAPAARAEALIALSQVVARTVGYDSAAALLAGAGQLVPVTPPDVALMARCNRAGLMRLRAPARADTLVRDAIGAAQGLGSPRVLGRCQLALAQILEARGRIQDAWVSLGHAVKSFRAARDFHSLATGLQFDAYLIVQYVGNFSWGRLQAERAISYAKASGNVLALPWAQLNLAQFALRIGDLPAAFRGTTDAEPAFVQLGDRNGLASRDFLLGDVSYLSGRLDEAEAAFRSAARRFQALGFDASRISVLMRLAALSLDLGADQAASRMLDSAVTFAVARGLSGITAADQHYLRGRLAMRAGDFAGAVREFRTYVTGVGNAYHLAFDAEVRIAEALALDGKFDEALTMFDHGSLRLDTWRSYMADRALRLSLVQGRRNEFDTDLGIATIVSAFATHGRLRNAFHVAELERARHLSTVLERRQVTLSDSVPAAVERSARLVLSPLELSEVQQGMPEGVALLEFVTGRGGEPTTVFLITRDSASVSTTTSIDSLSGDIGRFTDALGAGLPAVGLARSLGAKLVQPLATLPAGIRRLVIVPDGALHRVPFDALRLASGQALVERFATMTSPSARIALEWWRTPEPSRARGTLVIADPAAVGDRVPLPFAREEARSIQRTISGTTVRAGAQATEAGLKTVVWSRIGVVHFATHADVDELSVTSGTLVLGPGGGEDGRMTASEVVRLPLSGQLVMLAGCRTSGGVVFNGEGIQGLTTSFIEAGARLVVATQWAIGDRGIVPLVEAFYAELRSGASAAEAMRAARLAQMRAGASPAIWAAFTLTGDGDLRPYAR